MSRVSTPHSAILNLRFQEKYKQRQKPSGVTDDF